MEEKATALELQDIPDVTPLLPQGWWPWWAWLACLVGLVIVVWLYRILATHEANATSQRNLAYENAMRELDSIRALETPLSLSTALSLALRRYLAIAMEDPALFETHEEMIARHDAFAALPSQLKHELAEHFSTLCRYKYAPSHEPVDLSLLVPQATALLQQLHAASSPSATPRHD